MPMISKSPHSQSGISLIAAIFLLVGLAMLGALMTLLITSESESTVNEMLSVQALYAAESGIQVSGFKINQSAVTNGGVADCTQATTSAPVQLESGIDAWYSIQSTLQAFGSVNTCEIVATGMAGGSSGNPTTQREITVYYNSATLP